MEDIYDYPWEKNMRYLSDEAQNTWYLCDKEEILYDLSDKDWEKLCQDIKKLSYIEKVKILYDRFGFIAGKVKRIIKEKEYEISLYRATPEEDLQRWEYYVEQKAKAYCKVWMDMNASGINKAEDRDRAIEVLLNDIQNEVMANSDKNFGYKYGIKKAGLDSLDLYELYLDGFNIVSVMTGVGEGLGLYYAELELKRLQESDKEEQSILNIETDFTIGYRLVLLEKIGILEHLKEKYDLPFNQPTKMVRLLAEIMGVKKSSPEYKSFNIYVKMLLNGEDGPKNKTSKNDVEVFLKQLGLD
jgi:hypothetical protein